MTGSWSISCSPWAIEYMTVASLRAILLVDPDQPNVIVWERAPGGDWRQRAVAGLAAEIRLPALALALGMADIYEGLAWR
jgi:hypothetical protein